MYSKKKILIVEDDKMLSTISEMLLNQLDYEIAGKYQNGKDAIQGAIEKNPDVIIMDIHIKGEMNGIETAKKIQEQIDIPIIFFSSDIEPLTIMNTVIKNAYGFLVKPVVKSTLGTCIEFAFYKHKLDRQQIGKDAQ